MTLFAIALLAAAALPQDQQSYDPARPMTTAQLREDLDVFREALEVGHSGLYAYTSEVEMDRVFESAAARLEVPRTERELLVVLLRVVKAIHDGHTDLGPSAAYEAWLDAQSIYPPFKLEYIAGRAYIRNNYAEDENLPLGEEVVAINRRPMGAITRDMMSTVTSDGRSDAGVYVRLEGTTRFGQLFAHLYGPATTWTYRLRDRVTGAMRELTLPGLDSGTIRRRFEQRYGDDRPIAELTWHGTETSAVPVLRMSGMTRSIGSVAIDEWLKRAFTEIIARRAKHLIIDFRANGGGADRTGRLLMAHLLDAPFTYYDALTMRSNQTPFAKHMDGNPDDLAAMIATLKPRADGGYDVPTHSNLGTQQPTAPHFAGRVTVLIGAQSFSAATETLAVMWAHDRVTLVGSETGGSAVGNTSGYSVRVVLPHSGLRLNMPLHRYHQAVGDYPLPARGFLPDYVLEPTLDEILRGEDPVLEFALDLN